MYRIVFALVLSSAVCAACADVTTNGTVASADPAPSGEKQAEPADANCLKSTGSLLSSPPWKCEMLHGNVYDREQIDTTGANNIGDALRQLDPAMTISR
jgi:hypothetical protein